MICRYEFGVLVKVIDKDAYLSGYGVVKVRRLGDGKEITVNVLELTPESRLSEADRPRRLFPKTISTRNRKEGNKQMDNFILPFTGKLQGITESDFKNPNTEVGKWIALCYEKAPNAIKLDDVVNATIAGRTVALTLHAGVTR